MLAQFSRASGYLCALLPPLLLLASLAAGLPALPLAVLFGAIPLSRVIFGDALDPPPEWSEVIAKMLELLPIVCAGAYLGVIGYLLWTFPGLNLDGIDAALLGGSLWIVFVFASCVAHELVHRRGQVAKQAGRILSGVIGYPLLEHEHRAHHASPGSVEAAEWPGLDESIWSFTVRRLRRVCRTAWDGDVALAARQGHRLAGGLATSTAATTATALAFYIAGGAAGLLLYASVAAAVAWALQAVTYIQHWGLGDDHLPDAGAGEFGWEDLCQVQAWLTLGISYHQAHHRGAGVPYYRQHPTQGSPKAPAGYVVLLFASLVPSVWRALMLPALDRWKENPDAQQTPGRRLVCVVR